MKHYFFGKYYKFLSRDGFALAIIDSYSDEGPAMQLITKERSYSLSDVKAIRITENRVLFSVNEKDLSVSGEIDLGFLHPLKHPAMGPFQIFSMECSHDVYSMYHSLSGSILIQGRKVDFQDGYGYIEGDKGRSFPSKYFWYNSIGPDYGLTVAIATIPFGLIHFTGLLGFIHYQGKEYRLCTYNFGKVVERTKERVVLRKGKYSLEIHLAEPQGFALKAPKDGGMSRIIKENVAVKTSFCFRDKKRVILEKEDPYSSLEQMF